VIHENSGKESEEGEISEDKIRTMIAGAMKEFADKLLSE
jgi:hypothetical protein